MKSIDSINNPSLQPLPQNVQANISHNINSGGAPAGAPQQNTAQESAFPAITQTYNAVRNQPGFNFLFPAIIFIIVLAGFLWFLRKQKTDK